MSKHKITISVDSTADLGPELMKKYGLEQVNMGIIIGDKLHRDINVTPEDIYKAVEQDNILPKTNAALEVDYKALFEKYTEVIHINIGDKLSASGANARRAAEGMSNVHVIDSKSVSLGTGILAIKAYELREQGKSATEIAEQLRNLTEMQDLGFIVKDLKYIHRGGRASGLQLLGANLLKIRPSLYMDETGTLLPGRKFKGDFAKAVKEYTTYRLESAANADKSRILMAHSDTCPKIVQQMYDDIKAAGFEEIIHLPLGPTITTHCGRNTIGMAFFKK